MLKTGGWDEAVANRISRSVKPCSVFYDIGSNAGYMSMVAAHAAPHGTVVAFEPIPALASDIAAAAKENGFTNVRVYNVALADDVGDAVIYVPRHLVHASFVARDQAEAIAVRKFKLDDLIAAGQLPVPDVIKIDVEGAEMMVLRGAQQLLAEHRPMLIYECDENAARFDHSPSSVIEWLRSVGYTRFTLMGKDGQVDADAPASDAPYGDYVAE